MSKIIIKAGESLDDAIKRFKRMVSQDGVLEKVKEKEYFKNPAEQRKLKQEKLRQKAKNRRK